MWRTIVGVVYDIRERGYKPAMKPGVYIPFQQARSTWALPEGLVIRTAGHSAAITPVVRRVIAAADQEQPVAAVATMDGTLAKDVEDASGTSR